MVFNDPIFLLPIGISVDELLKFNMLRLMANNMTKEELIAIVTDYEFEFAHYFSSNQSFGRNPKNPFIYDKHYLLKHNDLIVHLSKLPPGTTIADVIDWSVQYGAYGVNVIKRQAEDKNLLRSALIGQYIISIIIWNYFFFLLFSSIQRKANCG